MKTHSLVTLGLLVSRLIALAQFNSGSSGAYGPMTIITNTTLNLPSDGIFHCTTVTVVSGATLRFTRNTNNTPVYLLARGDVRIDGTIDVSGGSPPGFSRIGGAGGPGGFDGGFPGFGEALPGTGYGPGGGRGGYAASGGSWGNGVYPTQTAGSGSYSTTASSHYPSTNKGAIYGSRLLAPLVGGSGGGGTFGSPGIGGGGGGGAMLIASNTRIDIAGLIRADGGDGEISDTTHINPGSGGAIRLVAPVAAGFGSLSAVGPLLGGSFGGFGRIRIDSIDRRTLALTYNPGSASCCNPGAAIGSYMSVFPNSRLDLVNVAGTNIAVGSGPVDILLPNDSPTNRTVSVQAQNFNNTNVLIAVEVHPENGERVLYNSAIDNVANNPATVSVPVVIPVNVRTTVSAWTR